MSATSAGDPGVGLSTTDDRAGIGEHSGLRKHDQLSCRYAGEGMNGLLFCV